MGVGGLAKYYVEISTQSEMKEAILQCTALRQRYFILGKGSNCFFDDRGFDGVVIHNKIDFCTFSSASQVKVGAGYSISLLGTQTARQGLSGLEFACGIPGSVGGAIYMNAGAHGHQTCDFLSSVDFLTEEGELLLLTQDQLQFGYRSSPFQKMAGVIVGATFTLTPDEGARKRQLDMISYRTRTQPYRDKSAGCVFRNPPAASAGALIEARGLKGLAIGGALVSPTHANFIVNKGGASTQDVLNLVELIKTQIKDSHGLDLHMEVIHVPFC